MSALAVTLVCCCGGLTVLTGWARSEGAFAPQVSWSWPAGKAPPVSQAPAAAAPAADWRDWAAASVKTLAKDQADALIKGDQAGFMAPVDPTATALVTMLRKRFEMLRAMGMAKWQQDVFDFAKDDGYRTWKIELSISYCVGSSKCELVTIHEPSRWVYRDSKLLMDKLETSDEEDNGPRPWEIDELVVKTGKRSVVATTKANSWRLPAAVTAIDKAAAIADKFAKWEPAPAKYAIFLAGPSNWKKWYGREQPAWAAAWAVPVGENTSEVVVRTDAVPQSELEMLMRHELTHVTSLAGARYGGARAWWMVEGIAEYAEFSDRPVSDYDGFSALISFVRGKHWTNKVDVSPPGDEASVEDAAGRYGVGYLAIRRIAERFGRAKMLNFFGAVMHQGKTIEAAAKSALGVSWTNVNNDCASYILGSTR